MEVYASNVLKTTQRDYGIDLLRIISMLMVPIVHVIGQGGILAAAVPFSIQYESAWMLMSFVLVAVNCFILITGYVYYGKETKYYRLATLWIEVLFYSIIILILFYFMFPADFGLESIWKNLIPTFYTNGQFSRYWFFTAYVGMFLISPFVNIALKHFDKKQDLAAFLSLFIIFSLLPTILNQDMAFNLNEGYSVLWFVVLYYTGGLLHKYEIFKKLKSNKWLLIYIVCSLISWSIIYISESLGLIETGFGLYSFNCYLSPLYFIGGIALVCFGVYLIHDNMIVDKYVLAKKFAFLANMDPISMIIGIILVGVGIFVACSLIDWIRELLFRKLKVKSRLANLEENIYLKFDNYLS